MLRVKNTKLILGAVGSHVNAMIIDTNTPGPSYEQPSGSIPNVVEIERRSIVGNCNQVLRHSEEPSMITPLLTRETSSMPSTSINKRPNKFIPLSVLPSNPSPTNTSPVTPSSTVEGRSLYKSVSRGPPSSPDVDQICTLASPDDDTSL